MTTETLKPVEISFYGSSNVISKIDRENEVHFKPINNTLPNFNIITTSKKKEEFSLQLKINNLGKTNRE